MRSVRMAGLRMAGHGQAQLHGEGRKGEFRQTCLLRLPTEAADATAGPIDPSGDRRRCSVLVLGRCSIAWSLIASIKLAPNRAGGCAR